MSGFLLFAAALVAVAVLGLLQWALRELFSMVGRSMGRLGFRELSVSTGGASTVVTSLVKPTLAPTEVVPAVLVRQGSLPLAFQEDDDLTALPEATAHLEH